MISKTAEYTLRAVVFLAENTGRAQTLTQISEVTHVPKNYLGKVMQGLVKAGLVSSQRGMHGGFKLHRDAEDLTALEVINAVEPIQRFTDCPRAAARHSHELCPLHIFLNGLSDHLEFQCQQTPISKLMTPINAMNPEQ